MMNENITPFTSPSSASSLENAASEFRTKVEDAATRLNGAAAQFVSMSEGFATAIDEARKAADRAVASQKAVEEIKDQLAHDYGVVSKLVADLQDRIAALATLARPLAVEPEARTEPEPEPIVPARPEPVSIIPDMASESDKDTIVW
ncbi:MAG TPA: hypothetical protein VFX19_09270 [Dehalococcoidia bacterium]|jgi:hypothetical protein|nr:hypothetical protein [Dehalococcoidia bacterium]